MNLWQIDDGGEPFDGQWCAAIWAWGKDEALAVAADIYEYPHELRRSGQSPEQYFNVRLLAEWPGTKQQPKHDAPHEERRWHVLRQAGWMEEGDYQCEACGLYPMGETTFCQDCWCCGECCECEYEK